MPLARRSRKASCRAEALHCCELRIALQNLKLDGDEQFGVTIVRRACEEPVRQIVLNCGTEGAVVVEKIKNHTDPNFGFNAPPNSTKTW
jgi:chaperonin GroEL (HSP60 family)